MTQKDIFKLIIVAFFGLLLTSCDKKNDNFTAGQSSAYEYPLKDGNSWNYHRTVILEYFNILDSTAILERDTFDSDYLIQNENFESLNDSLTAYKLISTNLTSGVTSLEYCKNNSQGLYCYAYDLKDGTNPFAKKAIIQTFNINNPINDILFNLKDIKTDSLIFENPPAKIISYPITYNTKWILRTNAQITVYKEIIGNENIIVNQVSHNCFKIRYSYSDNIQGNIDFVDYVSTVGLVKRSYISKNLVVTDQNGNPTDQRCNYKEEAILTSYVLN